MEPMQLVSLIAQAAVFLVVLSFALQARWQDVLAAMGNGRLILRGILAVNVLVPLAAVALCFLFRLRPTVETAIVIMAVSPLAPLAPGKMRKGGPDAGAVIGLYVALVVLSVLIVPATIALLSALLPADAAISVFAVGELVAKSILLPVVLGTSVATWAPNFARPAATVTGAIGMFGIAALVCIILYSLGGAAVAL